MNELKYWWRSSTRSVGMTVVRLATLTLGIGGSTAVFTIISGVLLAPLPYRDADRLVAVSYLDRDQIGFGDTVPTPIYRQWAATPGSFESLEFFSQSQAAVRFPTGELDVVARAAVSPRFFRGLGTGFPSAGREFSDEDNSPGSAVAMVSTRFSHRHFGGEREAIGRSIMVDGVDVTIIGVVAPSFRFPGQAEPDLFTLYRIPADSSVVRFINVIGRLKEHISRETASKELEGLIANLTFTGPVSITGGRPNLVPLRDAVVTTSRSPLLGLLAVAALLLFSACVNVANLVLSDYLSRDRERSIRIAFGAMPRHLVKALLLDTTMSAAIAGGAGLAIVTWLARDVRSALSAILPRADGIVVDGRVVLFVTGLILATSLGASTFAILRTLAADRSRNRGGISHAIRSARPRRVLGTLVMAQALIATVLVIVGSLLLISLSRAVGSELGFSAADVLTFKVPALGLGQNQTRNAAIVNDLLNWIRRQPGVRAAGVSTSLPLTGHAFRFNVSVEGSAVVESDSRAWPGVDIISSGYIGSVGIKLVAGRDFADTDIAESAQVALVNEALVRTYLPGMPVLGKRISLGGTQDNVNIAIVGVVRNSRDESPTSATRPTVYRPLSQAATQMGWHTASFAVLGEPRQVDFMDAVHRSLTALAPAAVIYDVIPLDTRLAGVVAPRRVWTAVIGLFAAFAVLLACTGVYGAVSYLTSLDMREFSVRLALGSSPQMIGRLVLSRAVVPILYGTMFGVAIAYEVATAFSSMLFAVSAKDLAPYISAVAIVMLTGLIGVGVPASRAIRADPRTLLRD